MLLYKKRIIQYPNTHYYFYFFSILNETCYYKKDEQLSNAYNFILVII